MLCDLITIGDMGALDPEACLETEAASSFSQSSHCSKDYVLSKRKAEQSGCEK